MTTPKRGLLFHFTHVDNLPGIVAEGLRSDSIVQRRAAIQVEVGEDRIKAGRRAREVPIAPGGTVADYVPFYFAARSPMLYTIYRGNVRAYQQGQDPLVYLVTDVVHLDACGCRCVFTDRNAYYPYAAFRDDLDRLDHLVDWPLMEATSWQNTNREPDRMERRMAEFLVHGSVPFRAIIGLAVRTPAMQDKVVELLGSLSSPPPVRVRPDWYF